MSSNMDYYDTAYNDDDFYAHDKESNHDTTFDSTFDCLNKTIEHNPSLLFEFINPDKYICRLAIEYCQKSEKCSQSQVEAICMFSVNRYGALIDLVDNPTMKMCLMAVRQYGSALKYIKNQTEELCWIAVQRNGLALKFVQNQTENICLLAVEHDGLALKFVQNQTENICLLAVEHDGFALKYVKEQTPEICLAAVQQYGLALHYVKEQTPEICLAAVQQNGLALQYVKEQTPEICLAAVQQYGLALEFVEKQTPEICLAAVQQNGLSISLIENPIYEIFEAALFNRRDIPKRPNNNMLILRSLQLSCIITIESNGLVRKAAKVIPELLMQQWFSHNYQFKSYITFKHCYVCNESNDIHSINKLYRCYACRYCEEYYDEERRLFRLLLRIYFQRCINYNPDDFNKEAFKADIRQLITDIKGKTDRIYVIIVAKLRAIDFDDDPISSFYAIMSMFNKKM